MIKLLSPRRSKYSNFASCMFIKKNIKNGKLKKN